MSDKYDVLAIDAVVNPATAEIAAQRPEWAESFYTGKIGRDPAEVEIAMKAPLYDKEATASEPRRRFSGTANQVAEDIAVYSDIGVGHLIFDTRSDDLSHSLERMTWLAEDVMPLVS